MLQEKYLSVRIDDEGNLKRIFHTDSSAEKLPDTTAVDEVLDFAGIMLQRFLSNAELTDYFQNQYIKNKELKHCVTLMLSITQFSWSTIIGQEKIYVQALSQVMNLRQPSFILQIYTSPLINFYISHQ